MHTFVTLNNYNMNNTEELIIKLFGTQPESIEERREIEDQITLLETLNKL